MTHAAAPSQADVPSIAKAAAPPPCTLVILGGSGDLANRKLLPALYNLMLDGVLPRSFAAVGLGRREIGDDGFRQAARASIAEHSRRRLDEALWPDFERRLFYSAGPLDDPLTYDRLGERLAAIEAELGIPPNRVFYLAVPPSIMETAIDRLREAGLVAPRPPAGGFARAIVEKPIGNDLQSARRINEAFARALAENDVFRIDHYLGKETVQNIMVMRFANSIFEPLWNQKYIDHVQVTVAEDHGIGGRAGYYEEAGALRDMVQNHILQLLSLTAMEPPRALDADVVRDRKLEVLNCLRPIRGADVETHVVRAQYKPGRVRDVNVPGYRREEGVRPDSTTETYVAIKLHIDNWRWAGVPFFLRTGKRLAKRTSEIAVQFKDVPQILFNADPQEPLAPNVLVLRLQPDEGLALTISTKVPGPRVSIQPAQMDFRFGGQAPEAYERLLVDVMAGDATLFMRRDAVEASWAWVGDILDAWSSRRDPWLPEYEAGKWGPMEADRLIAGIGRKWRKP